MEPIIFNIGEENGIVVETSKFQYSLFKEQYKKAFELIKQIWKKQDDMREQKSYGMDNRFSNIISFCGDRGEGKSSCMSSFSLILSDEKVREAANDKLQLKDDCKYPWKEVELIDTIDPAFFDKDHNILELLLGRMFNRVNEDIKRTDVHEERRYKSRMLIEQFSKVQKSMKVLKKPEEQYDTLENIASMSAGIELKAMLNHLFELYLDYCGKKRIVLCVDDIDLNMTEGYSMAELIRKYLVNPYCIILLAVKIDQMIDIVAGSMAKELKDSGYGKEYCTPMAQKYVTKFLPHVNRIFMPTTTDFCLRPIVIHHKNKGELNDSEVDRANVPLKEFVVQLIYKKTRYVFYNTQTLSLIIPTNLRELRHLIATLYYSDDAKRSINEYEEIDVNNGREVFQDYFYRTWVSHNLSSYDFDFARRLAVYDDLTSLNKFILEYFVKRLNDYHIFLPNTLNSPAEEFNRQLIQKGNMSHNVSLGDVFYVLWLADRMTIERELKNLIFYIKSYYSMRLYACYNRMTEGLTALYPCTEEKNITIHKSETVYEHVNDYQKLVNGALFSYPQNSLLPTNGRTSYSRDRKVISLDKVKTLVKDLQSLKQNENYKQDPRFVSTLKLCEFVALCTSRTTTAKEKQQIDESYRTSFMPTHLGQISNTAHFAIFDFMLPFYSLSNIEYTYRRFDEIFEQTEENFSLYDIADSIPDSILSIMRNNIRKKYENPKHPFSEWDKIHNVCSDALIRIADVQWAIMDVLIHRQSKRKVSEDSANMRLAYRDIQNLSITLYPLIDEEFVRVDENIRPWQLRFEFLDVLETFLHDIDNVQLEDILTIQDATPTIPELSRDLIHSLTYSTIIQYPENGANIARIISKLSKFRGNKKSMLTKQLGKILGKENQYTSAREVWSKVEPTLTMLLYKLQ